MFEHITYTTKNMDFVNDEKANPYFEELLDMSHDDFKKWVTYYRQKFHECWNTHGQVPRMGKSKDELIEVFQRMNGYNVAEFVRSDQLTPEEPDSVIVNNAKIGSEVDQFFPNMMATKINYSLNSTGFSIYDLFNDPTKLPKMIKGSKRHFRTDSFYHYSHVIYKNTTDGILPASSGEEWIELFHSRRDIFAKHDFWLYPREEYTKHTGYTQVDVTKHLCVDMETLKKLKSEGKISKRNLANVNPKLESYPETTVFIIRFFEKGMRIFPKGFTAFRVGYTGIAVNFPPLTAKFLYEKFTNHIPKTDEPLNIYDPSSGWGGRILGAMSVKDDRRIHYIGTDPNTENFLPALKKTRYEVLADFFNENTIRSNEFFSHTNTYDIFQEGSEKIHEHPRFQEYKGKLDLVFTSPPYFNREGYSQTKGQSYIEYPSWELWRDGFLLPTLKTAVEWLKPNRYLIWNIADIKVNGTFIPLEKASRDILESLGMEYVTTLKMAMANMQGQNRVDENGIPKCNHYCKVDGRYMKYEPIFVYRKPGK